MRVFYCDHFVMLPPDHSFPMAMHRLTREWIVHDGIVDPTDVEEAEATPWDLLRLVEYLDALAARQGERVGHA